MKIEHTFKAGVLTIGSLYWDNNNGRKAWREHFFGENFQQNQMPVKVPIRYGRYSIGLNRQCPTMVMSSEYYQKLKTGEGLFIPFKNEKQTLSDIICAAKSLSKAEGNNCNSFIKGNDEKWCIITYYLNPEMSILKKSSFERIWKKQYNQSIDINLLNNFKMESEKKAIFYKSGRVKGFPSELKDYDIILMTQTQPRYTQNDRSKFANTKEIAENFFQKPEYFLKNRLNGIHTSDDSSILKVLSILVKSNMASFKSSCINNGCTNDEVSTFLKNELQID